MFAEHGLQSNVCGALLQRPAAERCLGSAGCRAGNARVPLPHSPETVIGPVQFRKMQIHFNNSYLFSGIYALKVEYYDVPPDVNRFLRKYGCIYIFSQKVLGAAYQ